MSYSDFAELLSYVIDAIYVVLLVIVARRAFRRDGRMPPTYRETVQAHAKRIEGPLLGVLALGALGVTLTAAAIDSPGYVTTALWFIGAIRGALFFAGVYFLGYYWTVRESWL